MRGYNEASNILEVDGLVFCGPSCAHWQYNGMFNLYSLGKVINVAFGAPPNSYGQPYTFSHTSGCEHYTKCMAMDFAS